MMNRRYQIVEKTIHCEECRQDKVVRCNQNVRRRYCDDCQRPVLQRRKKLERENRKNGGPAQQRPRLVRYAGWDPSERNN